jgi:hypothetical protein
MDSFVNANFAVKGNKINLFSSLGDPQKTNGFALLKHHSHVLL